MSCSKEILVMQYIDGELPESQQQEIKEHIAHCPHCAKLYKQFAALNNMIDKAKSEEEIVEHTFEESMMATRKILQLIRDKEDTPTDNEDDWGENESPELHSPQKKNRWIQVAAVAAAVVFLCAVSTPFLYRNYFSKPVQVAVTAPDDSDNDVMLVLQPTIMFPDNDTVLLPDQPVDVATAIPEPSVKTDISYKLDENLNLVATDTSSIELPDNDYFIPKSSLPKKDVVRADLHKSEMDGQFCQSGGTSVKSIKLSDDPFHELIANKSVLYRTAGSQETSQSSAELLEIFDEMMYDPIDSMDDSLLIAEPPHLHRGKGAMASTLLTEMLFDTYEDEDMVTVQLTQYVPPPSFIRLLILNLQSHETVPSYIARHKEAIESDDMTLALAIIEEAKECYPEDKAIDEAYNTALIRLEKERIKEPVEIQYVVSEQFYAADVADAGSGVMPSYTKVTNEYGETEDQYDPTSSVKEKKLEAQPHIADFREEIIKIVTGKKVQGVVINQISATKENSDVLIVDIPRKNVQYFISILETYGKAQPELGPDRDTFDKNNLDVNNDDKVRMWITLNIAKDTTE